MLAKLTCDEDAKDVVDSLVRERLQVLPLGFIGETSLGNRAILLHRASFLLSTPAA